MMTRRRMGMIAAAIGLLSALIAGTGWIALAGSGGHGTAHHGTVAAHGRPRSPDHGPGDGGPSNGSGHWPGMMSPSYGPGHGPGMMGGPSYGPGMMGTGQYGTAGAGPVATLQQARSAAGHLADRLGLRVGEVMRFSDNFYAELNTPAGKGGTEVLIDPRTGAVGIEYGPAMMWNTRYGPHASTNPPAARVSAEGARRIADQWLEARGGPSRGLASPVQRGQAKPSPTVAASTR